MYLGSPRVSGWGANGGGGPMGGISDMNRTQLIYKDIGVQYKTNGTGRDTYIFSNNGGFSDIYYGPNAYEKPGGMLPTIRGKLAQEKKPTLHSKSVYYRQDGSGRDTYIA
jgi:hypothetical protein